MERPWVRSKKVLRRAKPGDAPRIAEIYRSFVLESPATFETEAPDAAEFEKRMSEAILWLVYEVEGRVAGYAYSARHRERAAYRWSADVSVYVETASQGKGIGKALYASLLDCVRLLGYYNAYGGITLPNPASVKLHESFGFKPIGVYRHVGYKLGAWHDVGWWELAFPNRPASPPEPRAVAAVLGSRMWHDAVSSGVRRRPAN